MMGLGKADTDSMSLWEYEARLYHWNEAHGSDSVNAPDPDIAFRILEKANADPRLTKGLNVRGKKRGAPVPE